MKPGRFLWTLVVIGLTLITIPSVIVIVGSFSGGKTAVFPPHGFSLSGYTDLLTSSELRSPVLTSAYVGLIVALVGLVAGVPAGLALNRYAVRGSNFVNGLLALGFATPLTVSAVGFLLLYTRLHLGGDLTAAAFGIAVVNLPFMIWSVGAAVGTRGAELEEAAATLGADEAKQFVLVTLPSIAPGIVLGAFMMFIFGITEFTMSVILINAQDATLPMYMFGSLRTSLSTSLAAIGALYIIGCIGFFWLAVRFGHLQQYLFRAAK